MNQVKKFRYMPSDCKFLEVLLNMNTTSKMNLLIMEKYQNKQRLHDFTLYFIMN